MVPFATYLATEMVSLQTVYVFKDKFGTVPTLLKSHLNNDVLRTFSDEYFDIPYIRMKN